MTEVEALIMKLFANYEAAILLHNPEIKECLAKRFNKLAKESGKLGFYKPKEIETEEIKVTFL